jgi:uncharacterized membrane protein SirB2
MGLDFYLAYATLKAVHVGAVSLSFAGFLARGVGALRGASWVRHRVTRVLPHVIDTLLLLSALGMLGLLRVSPWGVPWLRAKLLGLVCYIVLGVLALRPRLGRAAPTPQGLRLAAWLAALLVFGYIVSVAVSKDPRGLWVLLR